MNTSQTLNIKNGVITLPKKIQKKWGNSSVTFKNFNDTLILKKEKTPGFWKTWEKMKNLSSDITSQDIKKAFKWAKKQK